MTQESKDEEIYYDVYFPPVEIVPGILATWGAGDTGWDEDRKEYRFLKRTWNGELWHVVDCRNDMIDGSGNPEWLYKRKISQAISAIEKYGKVMICCLAGISRSNSIAAGCLMNGWNGWQSNGNVQTPMDYIDAIGKVKDMNPSAMMDQAHLNNLKRIYPSKFEYGVNKYGK